MLVVISLSLSLSFPLERERKIKREEERKASIYFHPSRDYFQSRCTLYALPSRTFPIVFPICLTLESNADFHSFPSLSLALTVFPRHFFPLRLRAVEASPAYFLRDSACSCHRVFRRRNVSRFSARKDLKLKKLGIGAFWKCWICLWKFFLGGGNLKSILRG